MENRPFEFDSNGAAASAVLRPPTAGGLTAPGSPGGARGPALPAHDPPPHAVDGAAENSWVHAVERGRVAFTGAFGDVAKGKRNWQIAFFCLLGVTIPQTIALSTLATRARITPYVVEVDKHGRPQAFGRADRISVADPRVAASQVAQWVKNIRGVVTDPVAQQDMVGGAYAFVDQSTAQFLQAYMTDPARDPRVLGQTLSRLVEVTSVLPLPGSGDRRAANGPATWKVTWTETDYPRGGGGATTSTAWEGYLTTRQGTPPSDDRVNLNPLGLFITAVNWTQITSRPAPGSTGVATAPPSAPPATSAAAPTATPLTASPGTAATLSPSPVSPPAGVTP